MEPEQEGWWVELKMKAGWVEPEMKDLVGGEGWWVELSMQEGWWVELSRKAGTKTWHGMCWY